MKAYRPRTEIVFAHIVETVETVVLPWVENPQEAHPGDVVICDAEGRAVDFVEQHAVAFLDAHEEIAEEPKPEPAPAPVEQKKAAPKKAAKKGKK